MGTNNTKLKREDVLLPLSYTDINNTRVSSAIMSVQSYSLEYVVNARKTFLREQTELYEREYNRAREAILKTINKYIDEYMIYNKHGITTLMIDKQFDKYNSPELNEKLLLRLLEFIHDSYKYLSVEILDREYGHFIRVKIDLKSA